ncbi:MAG: asparagine synthase (glutamine-hydrolyzing) [Gemmatimonadota bacterium]
MCGITGFWYRRRPPSDPEGLLRRMADAIRHRGPDDSGVWFDSSSGVGLGHRRLSILDLSSLGHQPMWSGSGRYVVVFNGEIYNFLELRALLERRSVVFRGQSDTEVIVALADEFGVVDAIGRCSGMFALAIFDRQERSLYLVRDRLGEKPLYYGWLADSLIFGSELKALRAHPDFVGGVDRDSLALFMRYCYIPAPWSIHPQVRKVDAGTILRFDLSRDFHEPDRIEYWSSRATAMRARQTGFAGSHEDAVTALDELLRKTVRSEMVADVPLGGFLSGGIDSSLVVAQMQANSARPIKTFTIGFHEADFNEAKHAKAVAHHLGADHTELYVTPRDSLEVVPRLPLLYDEPFADSSQIPTFLLSQLTRQHVTVSLSGDGGDELFGGYWRYFLGDRLWRRMRPIPRGIRRWGAGLIRKLAPGRWDHVLAATSRVLPKRFRAAATGDRLHKLASVLTATTAADLYRNLVSHWPDPSALVLGSSEPTIPETPGSAWAGMGSIVPNMMLLDAASYLPDDILVKVDRATMGVSLESRAPFLHHDIYEFAWSLPLESKVGRGGSKRILRDLLARYVPRTLFERPKMGFGVPIEHWLRGPLREWASDLLSVDRLRRQGFLNVDLVERTWCEHLSGRRNWQYLLWDVLMFQAWLET